MDISQFVDISNIQYISGQKGVSICTIASFYIGKYLIETRTQVPYDLLIDKTLRVLERRKTEIEIEKGIELTNAELLKYYATNNYIRMLPDIPTISSIIDNFQDVTLIYFKTSFETDLPQILKNYIDNVECIYNEYIIQIIHFNSAIVIVKNNNIYYLVDTHGSYENSGKQDGIIVRFNNIDNLVQFFVAIRNGVVVTDSEMTKTINIATFVYASQEFQLYRSDMETYIKSLPNEPKTEKIIKVKDQSDGYEPDKNSDGTTKAFDNYFGDWYTYLSGGGEGGNDCLIISFLTCTIPNFLELSEKHRYNTVSYYRNIYLQNKHYYKKDSTDIFTATDLKDLRNPISALNESVGTALAKYYNINIIFLSLKILKEDDIKYHFQTCVNKDNSPFYFICNKGGNLHYEPITQKKYIFEFGWTMTQQIIEKYLVPYNKGTACDYKQEDIISYISFPYIIISISKYDDTTRKCTHVDIIKKTDAIPNFKAYNTLFKIFDQNRDKTNKKQYDKWQQQNGILIDVPIDQIQKYVDRRQEQLFDQMTQLSTQITTPILKKYQDYLINQHQNFFRIKH